MQKISVKERLKRLEAQREAARKRLKAVKYAAKKVDIVPTIEYNNTLEVVMNYLTAAEAAEKWGISSRRVTKLCNEGRVKGAVRKSNVWLIPTRAEKPQELKRGVKPKS